MIPISSVEFAMAAAISEIAWLTDIDYDPAGFSEERLRNLFGSYVNACNDKLMTQTIRFASKDSGDGPVPRSSC